MLLPPFGAESRAELAPHHYQGLGSVRALRSAVSAQRLDPSREAYQMVIESRNIWR